MPTGYSMIMVKTFQVLSFGGELLSHAESLLRGGVHTTEVADGYLKAGTKVCHSGPHHLSPLLVNYFKAGNRLETYPRSSSIHAAARMTGSFRSGTANP
jgi:hypothetical protein